MPNLSAQEFFHHARESMTFLLPGVGFVDLLASFRNAQSFSRVKRNKLDPLSQFFSVPGVEEHEGALVEIVLNSRGPWSDYRLATGEVFEDANRRIDIGEHIAWIRDYAHVTSVDSGNNLLQRPFSEMQHVLL